MSAPAPGRTRRLQWRRLGVPETFGHGGTQVATAAVFSLLIAGIGALETGLSPAVPFGTVLLLVVVGAAWTLTDAVATFVALEAMAAPVAATHFGTEPGSSAEIKVAAIALAVLTVRLAVRAIVGSQRALQERTDELARTLVELERSHAGLERFTGDAAHELRSPLAVMQSEIDVALADAGLDAAARHRVERLATEVRRMRDITDSLLLLAQADAGALDLSASARRIDVVDFFEATLSRWRVVAEQRGAELIARLPDEGSLLGDPDLLARVVDNLLDNALRQRDGSVRVTVEVTEEGDGWLVAVSDDGPGVPADLRPRLFERFVRGERTRGRGAGLGLALSAAIVGAHNGTIRCDDRHRDGARFVVSLPAARAAAAS